MIFQDLVDLGVNPRVAIAVHGMVTTHKHKIRRTASKTELSETINEAQKSLCHTIKNFHGAAKTSPGGSSNQSKPGEMGNKGADETEESPKEESSKDEGENSLTEELKLGAWTARLGYALAKHLGADEVTALTASMYAFTNIPDSSEVSSQVLKAEWWPNGRSQRQ